MSEEPAPIDRDAIRAESARCLAIRASVALANPDPSDKLRPPVELAPDDAAAWYDTHRKPGDDLPYPPRVLPENPLQEPAIPGRAGHGEGRGMDHASQPAPERRKTRSIRSANPESG
jgi:hypothetical protein